jgi:hypothetical protein
MGTLQQAVSRAAQWWQLSCDLCGTHIAGSGLYFAEAGEGLEPPSAWTLCDRCGALVTRQLERIRADAPMRLRIAVGVAASELGVTRAAMMGAEAQAAERRQEGGFNRLLVAVVWAAFLVHAAAFVLVVVVIAASR